MRPHCTSARQAIAVARKMAPNSALPYHAEYHLISNDDFRALQILDKAASLTPMMALSRCIFRMNSWPSVEIRIRSPLPNERSNSSPARHMRDRSIFSRWFIPENFRRRIRLHCRGSKKWPNHPSIDYAEFGLQYRYGNPRAAQELLPKITDASDADMAPYRKVIAARLDPTETKIDDAIAALSNRRWVAKPLTRNSILLALGNFGQFDEVYRLLEDPAFQPFVQKDALFRPDFAAVRAGPALHADCSALGLGSVLAGETGYWPDFCAVQQLRYDCKTEAAKYRN